MTKAKLYFTTGDPQELDNLESQNLIISGISTLGITTATNLTSQTLVVSGVSTLGTLQISSGIVTATTGIVTYYGDGGSLINIPSPVMMGMIF
jgi:hypothetical protein